MKKTLLLIALTAAAAATHLSAQTTLTISEVYGGGGNSGSTYKNDFIELYNYGTTSIDVSALAVFYASATGTFSNAANTNFTALTGTIAPNTYYLIGEAAGTGGTTNLPTTNVQGAIAMSATAGKVALGLANTVPTGPTGTGVVDFIGFGATANQFEGTGPAPAPSNTLSDGRVTPGVDTNQNAVDFTNEAVTPGTTYVAAPEPGAWVCVLAGLGTLAFVQRRRASL